MFSYRSIFQAVYKQVSIDMELHSEVDSHE